MLVSERARGGMDALGGGTIEIVGGCLGASGEVIVWPHGTKVVDDDPLTIDIPDKGEHQVGDEIRLGGGMVFEQSEGEAAPSKVAGVDVPSECAKHDIFLSHGGS